jgi:hypothetical protein
MDGERRRRHVLHRQARELVYKVFSYFKRETDAGMPVHDVAKAQDVTRVDLVFDSWSLNSDKTWCCHDIVGRTLNYPRLLTG